MFATYLLQKDLIHKATYHIVLSIVLDSWLAETSRYNAFYTVNKKPSMSYSVFASHQSIVVDTLRGPTS